MAQPVYSVNAVGYVNSTLVVNKFNLIGNPLNGSNNLFGTVLPLADDQIGTVVYRWINASQQLSDANTYLGGGAWIDGNGAEPPALNPGEGVYIQPLSGSGATTVSITFVGEVPQGSLSTPLAGANLTSFKSSQVPQSAPVGAPGMQGTLELPNEAGDLIYLFDPNTAFSPAYTSLGAGQWLDADGATINSGPTINVAQGFVFQQVSSTGTSWGRTFSVN
jgi:hypothetical protein